MLKGVGHSRQVLRQLNRRQWEEFRTSARISGQRRLPGGVRTCRGDGLEAKEVSSEGAGILGRVARMLPGQEGDLADTLDSDQSYRAEKSLIPKSGT